MSFQAMTWAVEQELPAMQKIVLLMMANRTNHDSGLCFPSHDLLAKECGMAKRSVIAQIEKLEAAGLVEVIRSVNDKKMKNVNKYKLNLHKKPNENGSAGDSLGSAGDSLGSAGDSLGGSAGDAHKPVTIEPVKEPVKETQANVPSSHEEATTPKEIKPKKPKAEIKQPTQSEIDAEKIAHYLAKRITGYKPSAKVKPESWIADIEKAIRLDGRSPKQLCEIIQWIYADGAFWIPNILSGEKLRSQFDKMDMQRDVAKPINQPKQHFMAGAHFAKLN